MFTTNLKKIVTRRKKRIGRGPGSGKGMHTVGAGQKGQTSRGGFHIKRGFEGGQVPLHKRLPLKRGFTSLAKKDKPVSINIGVLLAKNVKEIDRAALASISKAKFVKLVGSSNDLDLKGVVVKNDVVISSALREKIVANGGKVEE